MWWGHISTEETRNLDVIENKIDVNIMAKHFKLCFYCSFFICFIFLLLLLLHPKQGYKATKTQQATECKKHEKKKTWLRRENDQRTEIKNTDDDNWYCI